MLSQRNLGVVVLLCLLLAVAGAQDRRPTSLPTGTVRNTHEMLSGVLWIQTSAEYQFLCEGVYASARDALDKALADPTWTAAIEQTGDFSQLPPAVILDIDQTVIDHSGYQAEMVRRGISPASRLWRECVATYCLPAVPGALEFIAHARSRGVTVFFVTNRELELQDDTRRNLIQLGVSLPETPDTLLVVGEQPGWIRQDLSPRVSCEIVSYPPPGGRRFRRFPVGRKRHAAAPRRTGRSASPDVGSPLVPAAQSAHRFMDNRPDARSGTDVGR